jgi:hypothetical protein
VNVMNVKGETFFFEVFFDWIVDIHPMYTKAENMLIQFLWYRFVYV